VTRIAFTLRGGATWIRVISARDMNRKERLLHERTIEKNSQIPHDGIRVAAHARDVPYQSLIKIWLQEKLEQRR
jgi:uncharacterized protein YajQ (UPF0234 family)